MAAGRVLSASVRGGAAQAAWEGAGAGAVEGEGDAVAVGDRGGWEEAGVVELEEGDDVVDVPVGVGFGDGDGLRLGWL